MSPEIVRADMGRPLDTAVLESAASIVERGGLLVYPAITLYGLGAGIFSRQGLDALFRAKRRPSGMPVSVMGLPEQLEGLCRLTDLALRLLEEYGDGLTLVLPAADGSPAEVVYEGSVAVRLAPGRLLRSLVSATGPLTATSANIHGQEPPATLGAALEQLGDTVSLYIDAGRLAGTASTLLDLTGQEPKVIRRGAVSPAEIDAFMGGTV